MKNGNENTRHKGRPYALTLIALMLLAPVMANAQIRIDWQQCYGNEGSTDYASSIAPANDGFVIYGQIGNHLNQGMCNCTANNSTTPWLIQIDNQGELKWQQCVTPLDNGYEYEPIMVRKAVSPEGKDEYYLSTHFHGEVVITKVDENGEELWKRMNSFYGNYIFPTSDGGVVFDGSYGPLDKSYTEDSLVKLDGQGRLEWGLALGEGYEYTRGESVHQSADGDYYALGRTESGAVFYRISRDGQIEWRREYGNDFYDRLFSIVELEDGFLLAGQTSSEMAGYHGRSDVWLVRTDKEGEMLWTRCYGGSLYDDFYCVFPNLDGGFTVFSQSNSTDGDVLSNSQSGVDVYKIWVFHINALGTMDWEQCLGSVNHSVCCNDVVQTDKYRYTLAGWMWNDDTPSGDVNCSNSQLLPNSGYNYWVLQVTDTINSAGVPEPMALEGVQVHPNPTTGLVTVTGRSLRQVELSNVMGQHLLTAKSEGDELTLDIGSLPAGIYFVTITDEEGRKCVRKVVKE